MEVWDSSGDLAVNSSDQKKTSRTVVLIILFTGHGCLCAWCVKAKIISIICKFILVRTEKKKNTKWRNNSTFFLSINKFEVKRKYRLPQFVCVLRSFKDSSFQYNCCIFTYRKRFISLVIQYLYCKALPKLLTLLAIPLTSFPCTM